MLVLTLFPGIGLLDRAFEELEFCVVRGPDVLWGGDIRNFHPPSGRFEGVIGGPPCQSFSPLAHLVRANGYEPRFGNLIPEFERCVSEAHPDWFLMENVPQAPVANVPGYSVHAFVLNNLWLPGNDGDGYGQEQSRTRRFCFGVRGETPVDLRRWIETATFELPDCEPAVTGEHDKRPSAEMRRAKRQSVIADKCAVPVKLGGSGKVKARTVISSDGGAAVRMHRYKLSDACRLQGLPEDFLADAPFRADTKLKAVANGVPLPMGRALAKAVKGWLES
jgi:DNA (cytosine-5)-methyltransferase 1